MGEHIVTSFDEDLIELRARISEMGGLAETQLAMALDSIEKRNGELADEVVAKDKRLDALEHEVERLATQVIARRQPLAQDLRLVISVMKLSSTLERVGDLAKNIAKRGKHLTVTSPMSVSGSVIRMGRQVQSQLSEVLDAYSKTDVESAVSVWRRDVEIDDAYNAMFRELVTYMMEDPRTISLGSQLLFIAKNLERIGDHTTHVSEMIYYTAKGTPLGDDRPKGDPIRHGSGQLRKQGMSARITVVEDEEALGALLEYNLTKEGYEVKLCTDGDEGLMSLQEEAPDLLILDWMLPGVSGIEICRRTRARPEMRELPIIMLTARSEEEDRIRGLDTGADDYLTKPFSMTELLARVRAVLRRVRPTLAGDVATFGDIILDRETRRVHRGPREVRLGPKEFRLLECLIRRPGRVYSREQLLDMVWGRDVYVEARTVDVHVGRLRRALNRRGDSDPIRTVRAAGYSLDETYQI